MSRKDELLKLLESEGFIAKDDIEKVEKDIIATNKSVDEILVTRGLIDVEKLAEEKAKVYNTPYISLMEMEVDRSILNVIPIEFSQNYQIICFGRDGEKIKIGITDPDNFKAVEAVDFLAKEQNLEVEYYLISFQSFSKVFKQYSDLEEEISIALKKKAEEEKEESLKEKKEDKVDMEEVIKSAPVAKIVSVIIRHAVDGRASDIHIEPLQKESRVRYRIDGVLHTSLILPRNVHDSIVARVKVLANLKLDETRIPQDGRIRLIVNKREIDFRVSVLPLVGEEKVVMRILDTNKGAPTLEQLGYSDRALNVIIEGIKETSGMLLVTGPTGSGKSTTLFSILNMLNEEGVNISTLEDPVEYFIKGVNQSQIRPEIGFNFASGLRSLLRQDPDVIMVGEIRDNETAELAIHASLTGHFVLSTLHTNSAIGAIPRLLDMEVESFLLGSTLNIVIAQRLARKICPFCKIEDKLPDEIIEKIEDQISKTPKSLIEKALPNFAGVKNAVFYKGAGCNRCGGSGYSGRIAVVEVLEINNEIRKSIISKDKNLTKEDVLKTQDFATILQDGVVKVLQGFTTMEEILRVMRS